MTPSRPTPLRIFGVGSPYGADAIAWQALEYLQGAQALRPWLERGELSLHPFDRPGPALIGEWQGAQRVVIIDALLGAAPGTVQTIEAAQLQGAAGRCSSHAFGVAEALELAAVLGQLPPALMVLGIGVGDGQQEAGQETGQAMDSAWQPALLGAVLPLLAEPAGGA